MGVDPELERGNRFGRADPLQQVAQALRPRWRCGLSDGSQLVGVEALGELAENGGHLVHPTGSMWVSHEVQGGRLRSGNEDAPARSIHALDRHVAKPFADDEGHAHAAASERPAGPFEADLELLRALVRGTVELRGGEETGVVAEAHPLHQRGDELLGGQAAERVILRRHAT